MPACSPSRVPVWLGAGRPWLCWLPPQLASGSASNPGQAQPVGSPWGLLGRLLSLGRAEPVPRQEGSPACTASASAACGPRSPVFPGYSSRDHLTCTSAGGSLVVFPFRAVPRRWLRYLTQGRGRIERLASPLFRALQSSQRCPSADHSLCCLEEWMTSLGAAAQKLCRNQE